MGAYVNNGLLRIARHRKGFSQGEAATRLGILQSVLSRYENGVMNPPEEFIAKASMAYDLPPSFFQQSDQVFGAPVSVHASWRKKSDVTPRELDAVIADLNLRIMHIRRMFEAVEFTPQAGMPFLDPEEYNGDIERIAATVRAHWLIPSGPFPDLLGAVERAGAIVAYSTMGGSNISGVTMSVPGLQPIIVLNSTHPADRVRFTLAHELGHIVMHRFPNADMERQADEFASALLMPANEIRAAFRGSVDLRRLAALKPEWRVAMQALLYRATSLGIVTKEQSTYMWKQFSTHRMRLREPAELDFPHEVPGVLPRMVQLHLDTFGYSLIDFAKMLHLHPHQINIFYNVENKKDKPMEGLRLRIVQ